MHEDNAKNDSIVKQSAWAGEAHFVIELIQ